MDLVEKRETLKDSCYLIILYFFHLIFQHVHPFSKVKKEKEYVVKIIKRRNDKWSKIAVLPRGRLLYEPSCY